MASYESAIPYIQKAEGGLSRSTTDTASSNPSPYTYNGVTGWHTNRGVTWTTFVNLSSQAGYAVTQDNFINMPDSIWLSIYKIGYWQPMSGDLYNSQSIANAVVDFAWGAGVSGAKKGLIKFLSNNGINATDSTSIAQGFNQLVSTQGESKTFNDLIDYRKNWFISLNQPSNQNGWLSRMETLRQQGINLIGTEVEAGVQFVKHNIWLTAGITVLFMFSLGVIYNKLKEK